MKLGRNPDGRVVMSIMYVCMYVKRKHHWHSCQIDKASNRQIFKKKKNHRNLQGRSWKW